MTPKMKGQGATKVTDGSDIDLEVEPVNRGRSKRPRTRLFSIFEPRPAKAGNAGRDISGDGGVKVGAGDEGVTDAKDSANLGDSEMSQDEQGLEVRVWDPGSGLAGKKMG